LVEDLIRRFTPTPIKKQLNLEGTTVALETNSAALAARLPASPAGPVTNFSKEAVTWRVVAETDTPATDILNSCTRLTSDGMAFVSVGLQGFFAYDRHLRTGIAFIPEDVVNNESLFQTVFLPSLVSVMKGLI